MMMYVCVNLSWNVRIPFCLLHHFMTLLVLMVVVMCGWLFQISLLLLLKKGGAVFTFIGSAVSLPLSHFAFAISTRFFFFFTSL